MYLSLHRLEGTPPGIALLLHLHLGNGKTSGIFGEGSASVWSKLYPYRPAKHGPRIHRPALRCAVCILSAYTHKVRRA